MKINKFWKEIKEGLYAIRAEGLEDFRAVLGAKTSRAADLNIRAEIDESGIETFLTMNLAGYGHASIGEMSFPAVHHRGIGWIGAWLVEDDPLFVGQEVSTRAVDVRKAPSGAMRCYDSPELLDSHNRFFWDLFDELSKKNELTKGYKFDHIRWAMPGTTRLGVTFMMHTRAAIRHLERLESIPFMEECVNNMLIGIKECSPFVFNSLRKKARSPHYRWTNFETITLKKSDLNEDRSIEITPPSDLEMQMQTLEHLPARGEKDYLDPEFKNLGLFKIKIYCSIAAARDWHRHRPMMPWKISTVVDKNGYPYVSPFYDLGNYETVVNQAIKKDFNSTKNIDSMQKMYALPFGSIVCIEGL
jgi:hypothetical protein